MRTKPIILALLLSVAALLPSCRKEASLPTDARTAAADARCREKWGKGLNDLPEVELALIGPQNENIQAEFRWAFSLWHAERFGQRVRFDWRDVGGGGASMETYLLNVYRAGGNPEIDVMWGGGEFPYNTLVKGLGDTGPLLEPIDIPPDFIANVPAEINGSRMYGPNRLWVGSAVSGFGFIYNRGMLDKCRIAPPAQWDDLAAPRFSGLLELTDPNQSGSAAAAYKMIIVSGADWPSGWAKLMGIMGNARRFSDSAGSAANSPVLGEAMVATCIDFYGAMRVAESPGQLAYVSPRGQTVFTPDPIGILKGAPHRELAQRFVDFVLSQPGQALWALPVGAPDGPVRTALGRQPIRRDVYEKYSCEMLPWIVDPYQAGQAMQPTADQARMNTALDKNFSLLRLLIFAAAVQNRDALNRAQARIVASGNRPDLLSEFNALPENISTLEKLDQTGARMKDPKDKDQIVNGWRDFFAAKYKRIIDSK